MTQKLIKKTVYSMPAFLDLIVQVTKEGKELNKHWTRASYGSAYTVAWNEDVAESATIEVKEATGDLSAAKEITEQLAGALSDEDKETFVEATPLKDLHEMTVEELRGICDRKDIKYHPASKEKKLIELIESAEQCEAG